MMKETCAINMADKDADKPGTWTATYTWASEEGEGVSHPMRIPPGTKIDDVPAMVRADFEASKAPEVELRRDKLSLIKREESRRDTVRKAREDAEAAEQEARNDAIRRSLGYGAAPPATR
jgi:hypothetical protein